MSCGIETCGIHLTPMVLYCHPRRSCFWTELFTIFARSNTTRMPSLALGLLLVCREEAVVSYWSVNVQCILENHMSNKNNESMPRYVLARVSFPPNRRNPNVSSILHGVLIRDSGCIEHGLNSFSAVCFCRQRSCTFAPGESWALVRVEEYRFKIRVPRFVDPSGKWRNRR